MSLGELSNLSFSFGQPHLSVLCNFEECAETPPGILVFLAFESSFGSHFRCSLPPCHLRDHWHAQGGGTVHDPLSLLSRIASSHLGYLLPPSICLDPASSHPPKSYPPPTLPDGVDEKTSTKYKFRSRSRPSAHRPSSNITNQDRCSIIKNISPITSHYAAT